VTASWHWQPRRAPTDWSPISIAIRPVDEMTEEPPGQPVGVVLERRRPGGGWNRIEDQPVRSTTGVISWLGLERRPFPYVGPPIEYRLQVIAEGYLPEYLKATDHLIIQVTPYDPYRPPPQPSPVQVDLLRGPAFVHPDGTPVARGHVVDAAGNRVKFAFVSEGVNAHVTLSDERGEFALGLRRIAAGQTVTLVAEDHRSTPTRSGTTQLSIPQGMSPTITVN
jgi:hypothetical protein